MPKKALLGLHGDYGWKNIFESEGYIVEEADSVDRMLEKMGIPKDSQPDCAPANHFDVYFMNTNLGFSNMPVYEPAERIYRHVKKDAEAGNIRFMSASANIDAVENGQKAGIPCVDITELSDFLNSL
jgi:hypothetical protein